MPAEFYILDDEHRVVECSDVMTWSRWMGDNGRAVAQRRLGKTNCLVSTVFLGIDHDFRSEEVRSNPSYQPLVFETMVFPDWYAEEHSALEVFCERYRTWSDAIQGHELMVEQFAQKYGLTETSTGENVH